MANALATLFGVASGGANAAVANWSPTYFSPWFSVSDAPPEQAKSRTGRISAMAKTTETIPGFSLGALLLNCGFLRGFVAPCRLDKGSGYDRTHHQGYKHTRHQR